MIYGWLVIIILYLGNSGIWFKIPWLVDDNYHGYSFLKYMDNYTWLYLGCLMIIVDN